MPCAMYLAPRPRRSDLPRLLRWLLHYLLLWLACALAPACKQDANPEVCCTTDEDCQRLGGILPRGCPDGFVCRDLLCESADCATAADCAAEAPVCDPDAARCTGCTATADCAGYADAPVCDAATGACRGCALDAECPSEVCDVDAGRCIDEADVIYASANGADTAGCTHAQPCSLDRAIVVAGADPASSLVRMLPGTYGSTIEVPWGTVTFVGTGAKLQPAVVISDVFSVESGAAVTFRGLTIDLSLGLGRCYGVAARTTLDLVDVTIHVGTRLQAHSCFVTLRRATMVSSPTSDSALMLVDSSLKADRSLFTNVAVVAQGKRMNLQITNSVLDGRGLGFSPSDDASSESRLSLAFSTIFSRSAANALSCADGMFNATSVVENNVIVAPGPNAITRACTASHNVVFPQSAPLPSSNLIADPQWVDPAASDLRLGPGSPAIDAAVPSATLSPTYDFLGVARPQGARPDIGAFERAP